MSYRIRKACMRMGDIIDIAKTDIMLAEKQYEEFLKDYTKEEIEQIEDNMEFELAKVASDKIGRKRK